MTTLKAIDILVLTIEFYHWWWLFICENSSCLEIKVVFKMCKNCFLKSRFDFKIDLKSRLKSWVDLKIMTYVFTLSLSASFSWSCSGRHILWENKSLFSFLRVPSWKKLRTYWKWTGTRRHESFVLSTPTRVYSNIHACHAEFHPALQFDNDSLSKCKQAWRNMCHYGRSVSGRL